MSYQDMVKIDKVLIPVIIDEGEIWYPITYVSEKVLLRKGSMLPTGSKGHKYKKYVSFYNIDYTFIDAGVQNTKCISEEGLKSYLTNSTRVGRLSVEQRKAQNELHIHLNIELLTEEPRFLNTYPKNKIEQYPIFIQDAIRDVLKEDSKIKWQRCTKCTNYYPYHLNFFKENQRSPDGIDTYCRNCKAWDHNREKTGMIKRSDDELNKAYKKYGEDLYIAFKENNLIKIYKTCLNGKIKFIPDCYRNKDDYLKIIEWLYENKYINENNLTYSHLMTECKLIDVNSVLSIHEIYTYLYGEDYYTYPWKYNNMKFQKEISLTYDIANKVLDNYLKEFNIKGDPLKLDYEKLLATSRLRGVLDIGCALEFAVQFNKFKYAGYQYKIKSVNYYKKGENLKFDLKYLIENDLRLPIDKIPLYLTKNNLHKQCSPLYTAIVTNKNKSIFEWINELYPGKFILQDFEINGYRNEFDSDTEAFIDDILRQVFKNVFYNQKHTDKTITLDGMIPDWFIFTENGVWIIEYFGMYDKEHCYNQRVKDYIDKTEDKLRRYEYINGYHKIFLYIEDTKNNFAGVREKIKQIR